MIWSCLFVLSYIYDVTVEVDVKQEGYVPQLMKSHHFITSAQVLAQTVFNNNGLIFSNSYDIANYPDVITPQLGLPEFVSLISGVK